MLLYLNLLENPQPNSETDEEKLWEKSDVVDCHSYTDGVENCPSKV